MIAVITLLGLLGCPLPPDDNDGPQMPVLNQGNGNSGQRGGGAGKPPAGPGGGGPPPGGGAPGQGEKPSGAPGGVLLDMSQMSAQKTQEEIATQDHVTVSGSVLGECSGVIRVDIIPTETLGGPKEGGEDLGPITTVTLEKIGEFSALVPKSASISLTALCDADGNQKITADVDQLSLGARLGVVDEDRDDVSLTLETIKPPPEGEAPRAKED